MLGFLGWPDGTAVVTKALVSTSAKPARTPCSIGDSYTLIKLVALTFLVTMTAVVGESSASGCQITQFDSPVLHPVSAPAAEFDIGAITLTVEASRVLREGADRFVGINLNYIRDLDANRPKGRPLENALKDLGVRWLRFPGGAKSDYHLWSEPPYDKPHPISHKWYAQQAGVRMDFDQYMVIVRSVGAEPYIVVGYGKEASTGRTEAQWLENAVAWVRYANVVKKYGV